MPAKFKKCVKDGGKVITKVLSKDKYMHICFIRGKSFAGEIKIKKNK